MNIPSTLPDHLSPAQAESIHNLFIEMEILPISSLFYQADEHKVITPNRQIPDDFIYVPYKGNLLCKIEGEKKVMGPGDFMMVTANKKHDVVMAEGTKNYEVFALHMHALDGIGNRFFNRFDSPFGKLSDTKLWMERLSTTTHLMGKADDVSNEVFSQTIKWLLYEQLIAGNKFKKLPQKIDQRISLLLGAIRKDCSLNWEVTTMASHCHLSVSRFRELFGKSTGISPKKYIQRIRLSHARSLLATHPSLSVENIANQVGIGEPHYFHAIYKEMFGETPKKSRSNLSKEH